jgi:hypothetical protein
MVDCEFFLLLGIAEMNDSDVVIDTQARKHTYTNREKTKFRMTWLYRSE